MLRDSFFVALHLDKGKFIWTIRMCAKLHSFESSEQKGVEVWKQLATEWPVLQIYRGIDIGSFRILAAFYYLIRSRKFCLQSETDWHRSAKEHSRRNLVMNLEQQFKCC